MVVIELAKVLNHALGPCPHFQCACKSFARWKPESGHIPRGYYSRAKKLSEIRLVIITAEPGDPADGESYLGDSDTMMRQHQRHTQKFLDGEIARTGKSPPFHRNLSKILSNCWPSLSPEKQWEHTWYTNTVLCSAQKSGGPIPTQGWQTCVQSYLQQQIEILPEAFILALGGKAKNRLTKSKIRFDAHAPHPSARPNSNPEVLWAEAGHQFQNWLESRSA
jgi:hypothetical protein